MAFIRRSSRRYPSRVLALATIAAALAAAPKAQAQSYYWIGGPYDSWLTGFGTIPTQSATTDLIFGINQSGFPASDSNGIVTNDIADNFFLRNLFFGNQAWNMGGKSIRFAAGGSINLLYTNTASTISNAISLDGALNVKLDGSSNLTLSGAISGNGSLVKTSTGTLTLSGGNTYTGGTTVSAGRLIDLNPRGTYVNNAALEFANANAQTYAGTISGTGSFTKSGAGVLTLNGTSTYGGTTTVSAGTLRNGVDGALPSTTALAVNAGGIYDLAGRAQTVAKLAGTGSVTLGGGTLTTGDATDTTFGGIVSGAGTLQKQGTGTLTLSGANSHTGGTVIDAGRLIVQKPNGDYVTNAALEFNVGSNDFNVPVPEYGGTISGSGSFTRTGVGTFRLTGTNSYTGGTFLNGGYTVVRHPQGTYAINSGTLAFDVSAPYEHTTPITGGGSFDVVGSGTVTLSALNTYAGRTTVFSGRLIDLHPHGSYRPLGGTLKLVNETNIDIGHLNGGNGTLVKAGAGTLTMSGGVGRFGTTTVEEGRLIDLAAGTRYVTNAELELGGANFPGTTSVSGTGNLTKGGTGTLNLASTDSYTGNTTVSGGRLITENPHGSYVNNAALEFKIGGTLNFGGTVTGTGLLNATGGGTVTLSGVNTHTGGTRANVERLIDLHPHGDYWTWSELNLSNAHDATVGNVAGQSPGRLIKSGAGTLTVDSFTSLLYADIQAGRLILLNPTNNREPYRTSAGANLEFRNATDLSLNTSIRGGGSFTKSGAGILTLGFTQGFSETAHSYAGSTTVAAGTLRNAKDNLFPAGSAFIVNAGATYDMNGFNQTIGSLSGAGSVLLAGKTLNVNTATDTTFSGVISGSGFFTKNGTGTLTLAGINTYPGNTSVLGGRLIDQNPHGTYLTNATLEFAPAGAVSFAGSAVTGTGDFVKGGLGTLTLTSPIAATGSLSLANGTLKGSTAIINRNVGSTGGTLQFDQSADGTYSHIFSGAGSLLKTGAGTLILSSANTYTGTTTVSGGILRNGVANALGTTTDLIVNAGATYSLNGFAQTVGSLTGAGNAVLQGGKTLTVNPGTDGLFSGVISDSGALVKGGAGTLTLSGVNTYSGGTTVNAGRLIDHNPHGKYVTNADLEFRNAATYNQGIDTGITGTGSFTKSGGGTLVLLEPNGYAGSTTLNEGTTYLSGRGSLPSSTALVVNSGATFAFPFKSQTVASLSGAGTVDLSYGGALTVDGPGNSTFAGTITYDGRLIKNGAGTLTLTGANRYTGSTFIYGGRLVDHNPHGAYFNSAGLEFNTATDRNFNDWIVGSGSFTKTGAGTLALTGNVTYTGGTTVSEGRLIDHSPHGDYINNAALEFSGWENRTHSGLISGPGTFTKSGAGTLTLSGANTFTGGTTVVAGRLVDQNPHGTYVTDAALEFANATDKALSTPISGTGSVTKSGAGTLTLAGGSTHTGGTNVNAGTLRTNGALGGNLTVGSGATFDNAAASGLTFGAATLQGTVRTSSSTTFTGPVTGAGSFAGDGSVRFDGGYAPGNSPALVTFGGDMILGTSNALTMELGGATLGTGYDHLTVNGTAFLGGSLTVAYYNGFSPTFGQSFDLFDFSASNGTFSSVSLPALTGYLRWDASRLYSDGSIQAVPEPSAMAALAVGALTLLRRRRAK